MRPQRRQPNRLPCPWDSPGKNTGVGCHFLLQCMEVKSESEVAQSCPTLQDPMDCSLRGSSVHGIFQALKPRGRMEHRRKTCTPPVLFRAIILSFSDRKSFLISSLLPPSLLLRHQKGSKESIVFRDIQKRLIYPQREENKEERKRKEGKER